MFRGKFAIFPKFLATAEESIAWLLSSCANIANKNSIIVKGNKNAFYWYVTYCIQTSYDKDMSYQRRVSHSSCDEKILILHGCLGNHIFSKS